MIMGLGKIFSQFSGTLSTKFPTAIITTGREQYLITVKKPRNGFFYAVIKDESYIFFLDANMMYQIRIKGSIKPATVIYYTLSDALPISFDEQLKLSYFEHLNPGTKISPEITAVLLQNANDPQYEIPKEFPYETEHKRKLFWLKKKIIEGDTAGFQKVDLRNAIMQGRTEDAELLEPIAADMIKKFGSPLLVIPPIDYKDVLLPRMRASSSTLGYIDFLTKRGHREYEKQSHPTHRASNMWVAMLLVGMIVVMGIGSVIYFYDDISASLGVDAGTGDGPSLDWFKENFDNLPKLTDLPGTEVFDSLPTDEPEVPPAALFPTEEIEQPETPFETEELSIIPDLPVPQVEIPEIAPETPDPEIPETPQEPDPDVEEYEEVIQSPHSGGTE